MALISRDEVKAVDDIKFEDVAVPEWGKDAEVRVKSLTGKERDKLETSMFEQKNGKVTENLENLRARFVIASAVDAKGYPMFDKKDTEWLSGKNAAALDRLFTVAKRLSGMSEDDVKELTENFD